MIGSKAKPLVHKKADSFNTHWILRCPQDEKIGKYQPLVIRKTFDKLKPETSQEH